MVKKVLATILVLSICMVNTIGNVFANVEQKKEVAGGYEIDMSDIPKVHFSKHQEWETLYNAAWEFHKNNIRPVQKGLNPELTNDEKTSYYVDEAFDDRIFQWDTLFMMLFDRYGLNQFPTLNSMDNFYYNQTDSHGDDNGFISRMIYEAGGNCYSDYMTVDAINPPLFGWAEWEQYKVHGDVDRFTKKVKGKTIIERIDSYYQFIKRTRTISEGPLKGLYVSNGQGNGLDNTPNQDWSGWGQAANDMSLQQVQAANYIVKIVKEIIKKDNTLTNEEKEKYHTLANQYETESQELTQLIQDKLWSEQESFFFNAEVADGNHTNIVTPTGLWSLVSKVATDEQAKAMIENYGLNSEKLFRPNGLATVNYDYSTFKPTGGYWNGAMWSPTSYQWIKGLQEYGYSDLAFQEAVRHINTLSNVYEQGYEDRHGNFLNTLWENYSSEYIKPGSTEYSDSEPSRINFVGWTGALAIASMIEDVMGITLDAPNKTINWNINLIEEYGISNLYLKNANSGVNRVSLDIAKRESASSSAKITVTADKDFTLNVEIEGNQTKLEVEAGTHTYTINGSDGNESYLQMASRNIEVVDVNKDKIEESKDFVYFTETENESITDGLKNQVTSANKDIYNVNTVGYRALSDKNRTLF